MDERTSRGRDASTGRSRLARTPDFSLTNEDLREVAASAAADVLPIFEAQVPGHDRPRQAVCVAVAQVNHILRSAAHAARAEELECTAGQDAAQQALERAAKRATPALLSVLSRYPATSLGTTPVAQLVHSLDTALRAHCWPERTSVDPAHGA